MANANWIANAQARPDVWWATPGTVESTSWFALTINHKTIKVYAGAKDSSDTATTVDAAGIVSLLKEAIEATDIPEWREVTVTMGILYPDGSRIEEVDSLGTTLILTGQDDGKPVTITCSSGTTTTPTVDVTIQTAGVAGQNEKQAISFGNAATGGTFTLSFAGQTTGNIAYGASAATVETAFEGLSSVGAGNGTVSGTAGAWVVEFTGTLAQTNVPLITGDGTNLTGAGKVEIATTTEGAAAGGPETTSTTLSTSPGTQYNWRWVSAVMGTTYFGLGYDKPAAGSNFGIVEVTVTLRSTTTTSGVVTSIYDITATAAGTLTPMWYSNYNATWFAHADPIVLTGSADAVNEVQTITVYRATGGDFTLTFQGEETDAITYSATPATLAAAIEAALEANDNLVPADIAVAYSSSTAVADIFTATFSGAYAGVDVNEMTADATGLTGVTVVVSTTQAAVAGVDEVQVISLPNSPSGGTFMLAYGATPEWTTALAYNISAANMDTALEALTGIGAGQVAVTGSAGGPWTVTFGGTMAATNVLTIQGSGYGLTLTGTQTIEVNRQVVRKYTAGTWVQTTRVFTSGTNPTADGVAVGDMACVFADAAVGQTAYFARVSAKDTTTITLSADAIEGSPPTDGTTSRTLLIVTAPTGPNYYDNVDNWELGALPADTDTINAEDVSGSILYHTNQSLITPTAINIKGSFTGQIGLPRANESYFEYRTPQYLTLGNATDANPTTITIGQGEGNGSGLFKLNSGAGQVAVKVYKTAPAVDTGLPAFIWKGTHASNTLEVLNGSVGVAMYAGETAAIATLSIGYTDNQGSDADVIVGSGCGTITTINKFGGKLTLSAAATTFVQDGGETLHCAGAIGTLTLNGGEYVHQNAGAITTLNVYDGAVADFSKGDAAVTVTNCTLYAGGSILDPYKRVTFSNPIAIKGKPKDLDLGVAYSLQRS